MTRDEATAHALCREAEPVLCRMGVVTTAHYDAMIPLIAAALAAEREACACIAENAEGYAERDGEFWFPGDRIAEAVRARGEAT
jgi:hypothetical protein